MNIKELLGATIAEAINVNFIDEIISDLEIPPNAEMGDYAYPCFKLAKSLKKSPAAIGSEIVEKIKKPSIVTSVQLKGAYLNFYLNRGEFIGSVISEISQSRKSYGCTNHGKGNNIVIDYSSPNIAKPFHVGHLRSTVIGNALYNIFNHIGYNCIGVNHLGDWGTQFGKLIVAYRLWGDKELIEAKGIEELSKIYVKFHEEAEAKPELNEEARSWLVKMQNDDQEALNYWKWFRDISLKEFDKIYKRLNISFDYITGESFYNDKMDAVVEELKDKNLLKMSDGAMIVDLEEENFPPCLILRSDGGTLYPTRDISAAFYRKNTFDFHKALYLTAMDQSLHFAQWFAVIRKMGYAWADDLVHVPFGLVSLESGKLSTRKGQVVLMEELLDEAVKKTKEIIDGKNPDLKNKEAVAEQVGIGAVIFNDLYNSRIKDVTFSWERMLNFEGETGPYAQYTHARACSVIRKAGDWSYNYIDANAISDDASFELVKLLYAFPEKFLEAADKYEPFIISRHIIAIAQAFNKFYHDNPILNSEAGVREARLALVDCTRQVLKNGLNVLGIDAPEEM